MIVKRRRLRLVELDAQESTGGGARKLGAPADEGLRIRPAVHAAGVAALRKVALPRSNVQTVNAQGQSHALDHTRRGGRLSQRQVAPVRTYVPIPSGPSRPFGMEPES
jgi:hypothetical protein